MLETRLGHTAAIKHPVERPSLIRICFPTIRFWCGPKVFSSNSAAVMLSHPQRIHDDISNLQCLAAGGCRRA